jgi:hypothetical protein
MDGRTVELILIGYVVSLPVVAWAISEILRIPPHLYEFASYSRRGWIATIVLGYACFGLGGVAMVGIWVKSPERAELRDDLAYEHRWDPPPPVRRRPSRVARRRERHRRHLWTLTAVSIPAALVLALAATALRIT